MNSTADMLRRLRESTGLNQKDFAASVGMKQTTYNGYETGKHRPKSDVLIAIADKYNVSVDFLLGISDESITTKKSPSAAEATPGKQGRISLEESNNLLVALGLIKEGQQLSDDDLAFLTHIVGLLEAWFDKAR